MSFKKPTLRTRRRAQRLYFEDAAMPMTAPAPRHVAKTTSYGTSPTPTAQDDRTLDDEARTVTVTLPPNWNERDITQLLGALVEQNNMSAYFGQVEPTPRHLGDLPPDDTEDGSGPVQLYETALDTDPRSDPTSRYGTPTLDPESMHIGTSAGTTPPGSYQEQLMSIPLNGVEDVVWCMSEGGKYNVHRRNTNRPDRSELLKSFPMSKDSQYWHDQTATNFRVFRLSRGEKPMDSGATELGMLRSAQANDRAMRIRDINRRNAAAWARK